MAEDTKTQSVLMQTTSAGPDGVMQAGQVYEVSAKEAQDLIKARAAIPAKKAVKQ